MQKVGMHLFPPLFLSSNPTDPLHRDTTVSDFWVSNIRLILLYYVFYTKGRSVRV